MICPKCGAENRREARFCTACGEALKKAPHALRKAAPSVSIGVKAIAVVTGVILIGLAVVVGRGNRQEQTRPAESTPQPAGRAFSLTVRGVASKFLCGCGNCDELELADCTCPNAIEGKELIDRELKRKTSEQEIVKQVNSRYGRIKAQYASLVAGASNASPAIPPAPAKSSDGVATEADAQRIASRFICACGRCQDHALSECNCNHPKGATEMKAFIQYKISQKRHTAEGIVKMVADEYGHLVKT
jgi:cytochrome c-type biogenesis protein CcmH/NrfF